MQRHRVCKLEASAAKARGRSLHFTPVVRRETSARRWRPVVVVLVVLPVKAVAFPKVRLKGMSLTIDALTFAIVRSRLE